MEPLTAFTPANTDGKEGVNNTTQPATKVESSESTAPVQKVEALREKAEAAQGLRIRAARKETEDLSTPKTFSSPSSFKAQTILFYSGLFLTGLWFVFCFQYLLFQIGTATLATWTPPQIGLFFTGTLAPVALLWNLAGPLHKNSKNQAQQPHKPDLLNTHALNESSVELTEAARTAMKAIARARQGLRSDMKNFTLLAEKTDLQINSLSENIQKKGETLLALTETIDRQIEKIDSTTQGGPEAWSASWGTAIQSALLKSTEVEESVSKVSARLETAGESFGIHMTSLSENADKLATQSENLSETIGAQAMALNAATNRASSITDTATDSLSNLNAVVRVLDQETEELESRMAAQANRLEGMIGRIAEETANVEDVSASVAGKLTAGVNSALSVSKSLETAGDRAVESLQDAAKDIQTQVTGTLVSFEEQASALRKSGQENARALQIILDEIESQRAKAADTTRLAEEQARELTESLENQIQNIHNATDQLNERIDILKSQLEEPIASIHQAVESADSRHMQMGSLLEKRTVALREAGEKARHSASEVRDILSGQAEEIATLAGQIAAHGSKIDDDFATRKTSLEAGTQIALTQLEHVNKALGRQQDNLSALSEKTSGHISALENEIASRCRELSEITTFAANELSRLDETMDGKADRLQQTAEQAQQALQTAIGSLDSSASTLDPLFTGAIEQASRAQERFTDLKTGFEITTETALERLNQAGITFEGHLKDLITGSEQSSKHLESASGSLHEKSVEMENVTAQAIEKIQSVEKGLQNRTTDMHLLTDQAILKLEAVQQSVAVHVQELSETAGKTTVQIENAGSVLLKAKTQMDEVTEKALEQFQDAGNTIRAETNSLSEQARETERLSNTLSTQMQKESETLLSVSKQSLSDLSETTAGFTQRADEVTLRMDSLMAASQACREDLLQQAETVADSTTRSVSSVEKAVSLLAGGLTAVRHETGNAVEDIERARTDLEKESNRFLSISRESVRAADSTAASLSSHADSLFQTLEDMSDRTRDIQNAESRARSDSFMSAAKFAIESLHSLSVDITRIQDGGVPEKTWKAYRKGDTGVFTRRLSEINGTDLPMEKAQDKFVRDGEFRTYVQRFLRQFEELHGQAESADHADLLGMTILSSDIGKLYRVLCAVADRTPVAGESFIFAKAEEA